MDENTRTIIEFPLDADGDALRRIQTAGSDMSRPMLIDFSVAVPSEAAADNCVGRLLSRDFVSSKSHDSTEDAWTVLVSVDMVPDYQEITFFQQVLDRDLSQFGAATDGWGTFGNADRMPVNEG